MSARTVASAVVIRACAGEADSLRCVMIRTGGRVCRSTERCRGLFRRIVLAKKAQLALADSVLCIAAATPTEIARKEPLDRAHIGHPVRSAVDAVSFVREQEIFHVVIARTERRDEAIGLVASETDVIGALHDQQGDTDGVHMIERGALGK